MAKPPSEAPLLHEILEKLLKAHPLLRSKLHHNPTTKECTFLTSTTPQVDVEFHDLPSTSQLLQTLSTKQNSNISPCHLILEHELNNKCWWDPNSFPRNGIKVIFASVYALSDTKSVIVLRLHASGCKSRGIKLCGALAAAGLIAAHSTKLESDQLKKKYGVVTLTDCRSLLEPALSNHHFWIYTDLANYKKCNKHFSDMADINFLMRKAIENPSLTASSSLRTSVISVFEDPVIDNSQQMQQEIGLEDYMGCASVHGVGPSIALFDTIRDGELDCACVYPSPLHSREQMNELVDHMKKILIDESI
ncbi:hypothetical protein Pfo_028454 [Paulownia fortunei]|nr:hypothetical protein Pfo_028454 [Paulownia fortunei]